MASSASTNRVFNANQVLSRSYNTTKNYIGVREQHADMVPSSAMYDTTEKAIWTIQRNEDYVVHPFRTTYLTSDGVQYIAATTVGTTSVSSKTSQCNLAVSSTINWPGLDGSWIDEVEFGLTAGVQGATGTTATSIGWFWQWKNSTATTVEASWKYLCTARSNKSTIYVDRTISGYAKVGTGYNKLPFNVRLMFFGKVVGRGGAKPKNSSYIRIRAKKTA